MSFLHHSLLFSWGAFYAKMSFSKESTFFFSWTLSVSTALSTLPQCPPQPNDTRCVVSTNLCQVSFHQDCHFEFFFKLPPLTGLKAQTKHSVTNNLQERFQLFSAYRTPNPVNCISCIICSKSSAYLQFKYTFLNFLPFSKVCSGI